MLFYGLWKWIVYYKSRVNTLYIQYIKGISSFRFKHDLHNEKQNVTNKHQLLGERKVAVLEQTPTHTSVTSLQTEITALKTQASFIAWRTLSNENANAGQGRHLKTPSSPVSQMSTHCNHFSNLIHIHATSGNGARGGSITCRHRNIRFIRESRPF